MSDEPFNRFTSAVVEKLIADTALTSMLGHSDTNKRIGESAPPVKGRIPFVGVYHIQTVPAIPDSITGYNRTAFSFECHAASSVGCKSIMGRVCSLLQGATNIQNGDLGHLQYFDFSNEEVRVDSCVQVRVEGPAQDSDLEVWVGSVSAESVWIDQPCS